MEAQGNYPKDAKDLNEITLSKKVAKGTGCLTAMSLIDSGVAFAFYFAASRILTTSEVGQISLFFLTIGIFNTLTLLALNSSVIKYVSENVGIGRLDTASNVFRKALHLLTLVSIPSLILSAAISPLISRISGIDPWITLLALSSAFILNYTSMMGGAFFGLTLFGTVAAQNIIFYISSRGLAVLFAFGYGIKGVAFGFLAGALICLAYSIFGMRGRLPSPRGSFSIRPLLGYSLPLYGFNILALGQGWIDVAVLYMLSADLSVVGIYYLIASSSAMLSVLWTPLTSTLFPAMSLKNAESGVEGVKGMIGTSARAIFMVVLPLSIALAAVSRTAITIAYGTEYGQASLAFTILAVTAIVPALSSLYATVLQALGRTRPIMAAGAISLMVDVIVLAVAVPVLSAVGAALARALMSLTMLIVLYGQVRGGFRINVPWKTVAFSLAAAAPLVIIERQITADAITKGIMEITAFTIAVAACARIFKPINEKDRTLLEAILPTRLKFIAKAFS